MLRYEKIRPRLWGEHICGEAPGMTAQRKNRPRSCQLRQCGHCSTQLRAALIMRRRSDIMLRQTLGTIVVRCSLFPSCAKYQDRKQNLSSCRPRLRTRVECTVECRHRSSGVVAQDSGSHLKEFLKTIPAIFVTICVESSHLALEYGLQLSTASACST